MAKKATADQITAATKAANEQVTQLEKYKLELTRYNENRETDIMKPFLDKQMQLYFDASEAAATIATSTDPIKKKAAEEKFWNLYWGPMCIVEDAGVTKPEYIVVEKAMINFGDCLDPSHPSEPIELTSRSLALAHAFRASIGQSSQIKFGDISPKRMKNQ